MTMISYAQNAEDVRLRRAFEGQERGFYVDVGAFHPESCSLTKHFYDRGWSGLNIEASPPSFERIAKARPRDVNLACGVARAPGELTFHQFGRDRDGLNTFSAEIAAAHRAAGLVCTEHRIPVFRLADLLAEHAPETIDFLNVDVEGFEEDVLAGAELARFRPRVLVVEATLPLSSTPSFEAWEGLVLAAGYLFATFDGLNRFYVREEDADLAEALAVPPSTLDDFVPYRFHSEIERLERENGELRRVQRGWLVQRAARVEATLRRVTSRIAR